MRIANLAGRLVIVEGDRAIDVETASEGRFSSDPQAVYERWPEFLQWSSTRSSASESVAFNERDTLAPVPRPRQVFAIGLNYRAHASESQVEDPSFPPTFTKFPTSLTGAFAEVELPTETVDWEVELVAVIGREAFKVNSADAWDHIAGVTVGQDLSERTVQLLPPYPQFSLGKSFPGFSPTGPYVVTADELADADDLALSCQVGDEVLQNGRTSQMIFSVPELIEKLSSVTTLLPGDLIFTGTPSGVGNARNPKRFLQPGQVLVSEIEGVGRMETRLVQSSARSHSPAEAAAVSS